MRVAELTAHHVRVPLKKPIRHASFTRTESDNLVVSCRLENGITGHGEGVPREYVTGETIEGALELLRRSDLPRSLQDFQPRDLSEAAWAVDTKLQLADVPGDTRQCMGNAARCAVELAILDACGRRAGQPVSQVTPALTPDLFEPRERVQYSGAITSASGFKARASAWAMRLYGFTHLKVKVGIAGQDDVKRLGIIRRRVGPRMEIRVDANEAWPPDEVVTRIRELERFRISSVEQPVRQEHVGILKEVRGQVGTPIMHDESLCSMEDAESAVRDETCDLFNIRLSKCGGFMRSLRLVQFAFEHGIGCQLGCQVGETALLSAAGRQFACSVRGLRWLEGSYDRRILARNIGQRDITFGYGGWAPSFTGPGLGIEVDESALASMTIRKEVLLA